MPLDVPSVIVPEPAPLVVPEPMRMVTPEPAPVVVPEPMRMVTPEPMRMVTPEPAASVRLAPLAALAQVADVLVTSAGVPPQPTARVALSTAAAASPSTAGLSVTASPAGGVAKRLPRIPHAGVYRYMATGLLSVLLLGLAVLLTPVSQLIGWEIFSVQSGSMEPTINVGGIVVVHPVPADQLKVGDVITFVDQNRPDTFVTHRIVELSITDGQAMAKTKGDANNTADAWSVPTTKTVGRVDLALPYLGFLMVWLSSPLAKVAILGIAVLGLAVPSVRRNSAAPVAASESNSAAVATVVQPVAVAAQPVAVAAAQPVAVAAVQSVVATAVVSQPAAPAPGEPTFAELEREILRMLSDQGATDQRRAA